MPLNTRHGHSARPIGELRSSICPRDSKASHGASNFIPNSDAVLIRDFRLHCLSILESPRSGKEIQHGGSLRLAQCGEMRCMPMSMKSLNHEVMTVMILASSPYTCCKIEVYISVAQVPFCSFRRKCAKCPNVLTHYYRNHKSDVHAGVNRVIVNFAVKSDQRISSSSPCS